jgi:hypothetical protein
MLDTSELETIKDLAKKNRQIEAVETKDSQG